MKQILFGLIIFLVSICPVKSQDLNTESVIKSIVYKWSKIHNTKNITEFENLYAPTVLFYGKYTDAQKCVQEKSTFLKNAFHQDIISELQINYYTSGTIKCSFTKQVTYKSKVKEYPSYLLLEYRGEHFLITGESDLITDQNLHVKLNLGDEITNTPNKFPASIIVTVIVLAIIVFIFFRNKRKLTVQYANNTVFNQPNTSEIDFDLKTNKSSSVKVDDSETEDDETIIETLAEKVSKVSPDEEKGRSFEEFIVSMFSKDYYKIIEWRGDKYYNGRYAESNMLPDLELKLKTKKHEVVFAVECKWRNEFYNGKITWAKDYQLKNYKEYEAQTENKVFVIIGIGGEPSNPSSLYIVPLKDINSAILTLSNLKKYYRQKKGNFFLDPVTLVMQ